MESTSSTPWRLNVLLFCHIIIALLFGSLFWTPANWLWTKIDIPVFQFLNNSLEGRPTWQMLWAFANHRLADWVEDIFILAFFVVYVRRSPKEKRLRCIAELIFCAVLIFFTILLINRGLFKDIYPIHRDSPTREFPFSTHLSEEIPWLSIKDDSSRSFPADHATTAILFTVFYWILAGKRLGILASLYCVFLCLPRLITGAHWLSDILVGSVSIVLFVLSWCFCTPFYNKAILRIEKGLRFFNRKKKNPLAS